MNLFQWFPQRSDAGLFAIRLALGLVFVAHGYAKLAGMTGVIGFFAGLGLPAIVAYFVTWLELLGGIALIAGVIVDIIGVLLAIDMAAAIFLAVYSRGFLGGYEFELTLLLSSMAIALLGAGRWSVSRLVGKQDQI